MTTEVATIPEPGQAVLVRGRPAPVRDVRAQTGNEAAAHLVEVEYLDGWEFPGEDTVPWEAEIDARVLQGGGLPRVGDGLDPDPPERFAAFCDALRWSSAARLPGLTSEGRALLARPPRSRPTWPSSSRGLIATLKSRPRAARSSTQFEAAR